MGAADDFLNFLGKELYGITRDEAHAQGICIKCKSKPQFRCDGDLSEWKLSALCPNCFSEETEDD